MISTINANIYLRHLKSQLTAITLSCAIALRPPEKTMPNEWGEKNLYLSLRVTPRPGIIRLEPHQHDPCIWFITERHSVHCWAAQVGKSAMLQLLIAYVADVDPGPALVVYPDQQTAKRRSRKHLQTMFEDCPVLVKHKTGRRDDIQLYEYMLDRMTINIAWSGSPSALAAESIRYLFRDEIGKFSGATDKEADSLSLSEMRVTAFGPLARIFDTSTPTVPNCEPWLSFEKGCQYLRFVPCPHCGEFTNWEFENFDYPQEQETDENWSEYLDRVEKEAVIRCPKCSGAIKDRGKIKMLKKAEWRKMNESGKICSSRLPSWYARYVSFGQIAREYMEAKGNPEKMRNFMNSRCGLPYESTSHAADRNMIRAHNQDYVFGEVVSSEPCIIVMTVDLHKRFQRYLVRAHSVSGSWLIDYGNVRTTDELHKIREELEYRSPDSKKIYKIDAVFCDCQYNPEFVYDWAQSDSTVFPMTGKCKTGIISFTTAKEKPDVQIYNIADCHFKDSVLDSINSGFDPENEQAPYNNSKSYWFLPDTAGSNEVYKQQPPKYNEEKYLTEMLAEEPIEKEDNKHFIHREWICLNQNNHFFDLEKYQCAARYMLSDRLKEISQPPTQNNNKVKQEVPEGY